MDNKGDKAKNIRPQDEMPYEIRMKNIIEAYRKDIKRLEDLSRYAKGLEEENVNLQKRIEVYESWTEGAPNQKDFINQLSNKIAQMQGLIKKTYPKRVIKVAALKTKAMQQYHYIQELQGILKSNGIEYPEMEVDPLSIEGNYKITDIDVFAVRGKHETFESDPLDVIVPPNK